MRCETRSLLSGRRFPLIVGASAFAFAVLCGAVRAATISVATLNVDAGAEAYFSSRASRTSI